MKMRKLNWILIGLSLAATGALAEEAPTLKLIQACHHVGGPSAAEAEICRWIRQPVNGGGCQPIPYSVRIYSSDAGEVVFSFTDSQGLSNRVDSGIGTLAFKYPRWSCKGDPEAPLGLKCSGKLTWVHGADGYDQVADLGITTAASSMVPVKNGQPVNTGPNGEQNPAVAVARLKYTYVNAGDGMPFEVEREWSFVKDDCKAFK
jgi:hypothetical protein